MNPQPTPAPQVAILGGINGAGKTTASQRILRDAMHIPVFTNADAIARGLNAFDPESEAAAAGRVMLTHMREMIAKRRSFAFETTLAARTYVRWITDMRRVGYNVHLFYFWLESADTAIRRVAERVRSGGHFVPDDTIRRRYSRSVSNFFKLYRPVVTTWQVYDNTYGESRLVAFSNGHFDTVLNDARWGLFQRSADDDSADRSNADGTD